MAGPEHPEMAMVERGQFRLVQALDDGQDGRIDEANTRVAVALAEEPVTMVIGRDQIFNDEHGSRDHKWFAGQIEKTAGPPIVGVRPI